MRVKPIDEGEAAACLSSLHVTYLITAGALISSVVPAFPTV